MKLLQAGPLHVGYESGFLRRLTYGDAEVLRMIYFALRDHNWNTIAGQIENERITDNGDRFEITYDYLNIHAGVPVLEWKVKINGNSDGGVVFEIAGQVNEDFRKNRAGFCVLHPLDFAGQPCSLRHAGGNETTARFPVDVAADNPFLEVQSMSWKSGDARFEMLFEGDIFETEDQRNWGDASYKTFCTPQRLPFPAIVKRGDRIFQRVSFKPLTPLASPPAKAPYITLTESTTRARLPRIGIGASTEVDTLSDAAVSLLAPLRLSHYRLDLVPANKHWVTEFSGGYEQAHRLGVALEVVLHLSDNFSEELNAFVVLCQQNRVRLRKVLLLQTDRLVTGQGIIDEIPDLKSLLPGVEWGVGTNYNFNEINKNRFDVTAVDFISFAMAPQEHATDDLTLLENTETLEHLVKSARSTYGSEMAVHLSPLTLRKRFNPYATNPEDLYISESQKADVRQKDEFAAAWTFASLRSLARAGASAVTFYQTVGDQGVLTAEGIPYPVFDILKAVAAFQKKEVHFPESSDPLTVQGLVLDGKVLGLTNLTRHDVSVRWQETEILLKPLETRFELL